MAIVGSTYRFAKTHPVSEGSIGNYRSEYSRDYARVLHSPSFRRLQNKTQLFPGNESDFFRNRLTHSLEVSQIAKSIAVKLKNENKELEIIEPDVCEIAGLIHDIGHPPFGHNGERALDEQMRDCGGFEGNAQTLRVITRLEKKEDPPYIIRGGVEGRVGLNLTARVIASALKYDKMIPRSRDKAVKLVKGYYESEKPIIDEVKRQLVEHPEQVENFKTIECGIMDLADDIAYSTYDVEDAFKADFLTPYEMLAASDEMYEKICEKMKGNGIPARPSDCREALRGLFADVWDEPIKKQADLKRRKNKEEEYNIATMENFLTSYNISKALAHDGYYRTRLTSNLVNRFINGIQVEVNRDNPILSQVEFDDETKLRVNILKHFSYVSLISSSRLKVVENRGEDIINKMFTRILDRGHALLPEDIQFLQKQSDDNWWQKRVVCDFIAGMTDRYALEFYGRLFSENPQTIFKPL